MDNVTITVYQEIKYKNKDKYRLLVLRCGKWRRDYFDSIKNAGLFSLVTNYTGAS